jgi:hypothetical protein
MWLLFLRLDSVLTLKHRNPPCSHHALGRGTSPHNPPSLLRPTLQTAPWQAPREGRGACAQARPAVHPPPSRASEPRAGKPGGRCRHARHAPMAPLQTPPQGRHAARHGPRPHPRPLADPQPRGRMPARRRARRPGAASLAQTRFCNHPHACGGIPPPRAALPIGRAPGRPRRRARAPCARAPGPRAPHRAPAARPWIGPPPRMRRAVMNLSARRTAPAPRAGPQAAGWGTPAGLGAKPATHPSLAGHRGRRAFAIASPVVPLHRTRVLTPPARRQDSGWTPARPAALFRRREPRLRPSQRLGEYFASVSAPAAPPQPPVSPATERCGVSGGPRRPLARPWRVPRAPWGTEGVIYARRARRSGVPAPGAAAQAGGPAPPPAVPAPARPRPLGGRVAAGAVQCAVPRTAGPPARLGRAAALTPRPTPSTPPPPLAPADACRHASAQQPCRTFSASAAWPPCGRRSRRRRRWRPPWSRPSWPPCSCSTSPSPSASRRRGQQGGREGLCARAGRPCTPDCAPCAPPPRPAPAPARPSRTPSATARPEPPPPLHPHARGPAPAAATDARAPAYPRHRPSDTPRAPRPAAAPRALPCPRDAVRPARAAPLPSPRHPPRPRGARGTLHARAPPAAGRPD